MKNSKVVIPAFPALIWEENLHVSDFFLTTKFI